MSSLRAYRLYPCCTIRGCFGDHHAKGLCHTHYERLLRHGDPHKVLPKVGPKPKHRQCELPDCVEKHKGRGMCAKHLYRWRRRQADPPRQRVRREPELPPMPAKRFKVVANV